MRIAICFSGQIRTGVEASENIKRFLGDLLPYCDFFIHTWNINSQKNYAGTIIYPDEEYISEDNINRIINIYKPKKIIIEDYNIFRFNKKSRDIMKNNITAQWYSFNKSVEYKKEYEKDNNFEYDLVVKLRFDIIYSNNRSLLDDYFISLDNYFYIENFAIVTDKIEDLPFIDDVYYLGTSKDMNIMSDYYDYMIKNNLKHKYGYELLKYLDSFNINYNTEGFKKNNQKYTVYRPECLKYSCINDFDMCFECDRYYYSVIGSSLGKYFNDLDNIYHLDKNIYNLSHKIYVSELNKKL